MNMETANAKIISAALLVLFLSALIWRYFSRRKAKNGFSKKGIYQYMRYPAFSATIFFLNTAIAFYFRSWLLILVLPFIYWAWKRAVANDEVFIVKDFGDTYRQYRFKTPTLIPKITNQRLFFLSAGLLIFIIAFISLNFFTFYFRYVGWDEKSAAENLTFKIPPINASFLPNSEKIKYDKPDSIIIDKIGITAPLIATRAKNEKELIPDLDKGVVIYPGSVLPSQIGNFFLTGHSSTYFWKRDKTPYGEVFAGLDKLQIGDRIVIYYNQYKYEYEIFNKYIALPNNVRLYHPSDDSIISLMTCWPIGTTWKRLVLEGKLMQN